MARLVGELVAVDWDENDEPTEIALELDGERYRIAHNDKFEELVRYVGHELEVDGKVVEEEAGEAVVAVRTFEILELMTEDDAEEYGDDEEVPEELW